MGDALDGTATFPYPGGKSEYVDWIVSLIPPHECYVEPFGGSGTVILNKPRSPTEVYNDQNEDVVAFFRVLRERGDDLHEWLENVPYSRAVYEEWADAWFAGDRPDDPVEHAGRFFALRYMQINARLDVKAGFLTRNQWPPSRTFKNAVDRLPAVRDRYRDVIIERGDWAEVVDLYDDPDTLFYLDPPYADSGDYYAAGVDRDELAATLADVAGDWMLSCRRVPDDVDPVAVRSVETNLEMANRSDSTETVEKLALSFDPDDTARFVGDEQVQTKLSDVE